MPTLHALGWNTFFADQLSPGDRTEYTVARVTADFGSAYVVRGQDIDTQARLSGKFRHDLQNAEEFPAVGDWVLVRPQDQSEARIEKRLQRKSQLVRRRPHDRAGVKLSFQSQVLASNLDLVYLVTSLNQDLNPARLERALTMVWDCGATPVILLSKSDLVADALDKQAQVQNLAPGVDVHTFSSVTHDGLEAVYSHLREGLTACLIGSSGVGKTTLINHLGHLDLPTASIREDDGKGRHVTSARSLFVLPQGGLLIDTPGLREFGLWGGAESLDTVFADIVDLAKACKFKDCAHQQEPGCAVQAAVTDGRLEAARLEQYHKLVKETEYLDSRHSAAKMQEVKQQQKQLGKIIKGFNKQRKSRYQL